jgi:hypothetical protein
MLRTHALEDSQVRRLAVVVAVGAVALVIQLVPLPFGLLMWLSPGVDAFLREYLLAYQRPAYHARAIDPGFTAVALGL